MKKSGSCKSKTRITRRKLKKLKILQKYVINNSILKIIIIMKNTPSSTTSIVESPDIIFTDSSKNKYWFSIQAPENCEAPMEFIDKVSGYLIASFYSKDIWTRIFFRFKNDKTFVSINEREQELENTLIEENINNEYTVQRKIEINNNTWQEIYKDKLLKNNEVVYENWYYFNWNKEIDIAQSYIDYLEEKKWKEESGKQKNKYINFNKQEKVSYFWDYIIKWWYYSWWRKVRLSSMRTIEPNIENLFPLIEKSIREYSPELWLNYYVDFDDTPNQSNRIGNIEWIYFNNIELAEKVWDLFYNGLSNFLTYLSENTNIETKEWTRISELLKKASENINKAWIICEPYIRTDFKEMKHTDTIKWSDISNENLAQWIWNLYLEQLWDFLSQLSQKLEKDWLADELRWRTKLANELFESSKAILEASDIVISLSNRKSSYTLEKIKEQKEWFLSRIWKLLW